MNNHVTILEINGNALVHNLNYFKQKLNPKTKILAVVKASGYGSDALQIAKFLKERLLNRHEGQENLVEERMKKFNEEVSHWNEYNYIVVNDDLDACYEKISNFIKAEKKGVRQTQDLNEIKNKVNELIK